MSSRYSSSCSRDSHWNRDSGYHESYHITPYFKRHNNFTFTSPMQERRKESYAEVNERIDYKVLFEKEKLEKERCEQRLKDMEMKQQVLENNLRKFLDLKNEFSFLQHEAEESDKMVNNFIMVR